MSKLNSKYKRQQIKDALKQEQKKKREEQEKQEVAYGINLRKIRRKRDYAINTINGRYHLARYNMIAEQLTNKKIDEKIDGATKSEDLMIAEAALMKRSAIDEFREAYFAKKDLAEKFNCTPEEIEQSLAYYYDGKIVREQYSEDDEYRKKSKAEFVNANDEDS